MKAVWTVRLSQTASADFSAIVRWTAERFGPAQAAVYADTLTSALVALADGPNVPGAKLREDLGSGLGVLHVARQGRRGRHLVVFRRSSDQALDIVRLQHDSMDIVRHIDVPADQDRLGEARH